MFQVHHGILTMENLNIFVKTPQGEPYVLVFLVILCQIFVNVKVVYPVYLLPNEVGALTLGGRSNNVMFHRNVAYLQGVDCDMQNKVIYWSAWKEISPGINCGHLVKD
ncbi:uncharacterized protein LOC143245300 isoform X3 [Tachypleus tridentatus]|uniref:uncharacterized protein LOC143245300 isoform X3 n=1 Tax=Tachypleus tridentatus TaxID=6853 RepID=UPI003FD08C31